MSLNIKLDSRLQAIADFVRPNRLVIDVGTDHGYLCVYLVQNHIVRKATAVDVNEKPLESAKKNFQRFSVGDAVQCYISDGLDEVDEQEADDIVIAGMGGERIIAIISRTQWLKDKNKRLILQPMTGFNLLRRYLYKEGYEILDEAYACVDEKPYNIMHVVYSGTCKNIDDSFAYFGNLLKRKPLTEAEMLYYQKQLRRIQNLKRGAFALKNFDLYNRYNDIEEKAEACIY